MRLKIRLLILYTCVGIAVLAVVGSVLFVQVRNNRSADLEQELTNQLMHLDFALTNLMEEAENNVLQLSENEIVRTTDDADFTSFLDANESTFEYNIGETEQDIIDILNAYMTTHDYVNSVYMGRENGTFVRSHPRASPTQYDPRERPWYIAGQENPGQVIITEPYESLTTTDVNIGVVTALVGDDGEVYGVLGADITLKSLTEYMSDFEVGYQGHMLLADENGTILAFSDSEFLFDNVEALLGDAAADMMNRSQGVMTVETESGSYYLYLYTSPELGWKLAVMAPTNVINGVTQGPFFISLFGLFIALTLLILLTFIGLSTSVIKPLKRLSELTLDITNSGDLNRKTDITAKNEIGTLAASFDRMTDAIREKEEALSVSEKRYRRLFEAAQDGILILDAETGMVVDVNPFLVELLGYSHEQFAGKAIWELGTFKDIIPSRDHFLELQQQGYIRYEDLPLETADGRRIEVEFVSNVYLVGNDKVIQCNIRNITERKRAEEAAAAALRESEKKYREVVERANDGIIILQDTIIQYANQRVSDIAGFEPEEAIGTSIVNYIHPDELPKILDRYKRRMAGEHVPSTYETVLVHKDGHKINVELNAGIINYQGKPADMVIIRDITERKKAEKILSESESKLRTIFESVTDAVFVFDMSGFIREINKAACEMHGYTYNELIGTNAKNLVAPESHKQFADYLLTVGKGQSFSAEAKDIRKDGTTFYMEARGVPIVWNGELLLLGVIRDVTERKQAEEALRESEERYRSLFSESLDGLCLAEAETGNIVDCNQMLADMVGRDKAELIGQPQSILHPSTGDKASLSSTFRKHMADKQGQVLETQIITKTGEVREVEIKANKLELRDTEMLLGIFRDITERKRAEKEIIFKGMLLDAAADSILVHDLSGRIVYANKVAEEFRGYSTGELIGKNLHEISTPDCAEGFDLRIDEIKQKGEAIFEVDHYRRDGSTIPIEVHALMIDRGGEEMILRIGRDITERKRADHQINERMKELWAFYNLADLTEKEGTVLEKLYQSLVNILPQSWQYTEITYCRIVIGDSEFRTENFKESPWMQSAPIKVHGSAVGRIEVGYLEERAEDHEGPFMKEERLLIDSLAERIGRITERKQAEEALKDNQELLEEAYGLANIGVWDWIIETDTVKWTDQLYEIFGRNKDLPAPSYAEHPKIYTSESWNLLDNAVKNVLNTGESYNLELELIRPGGEIRWINAIGGAKFDQTGRIIGLHGTVQDITERKRAEEALRKSEEKYRTLTEATSDIVYSMDKMGNLTFIGPQVARYDKNPEKMVGRNLLDFMHPEDREKVLLDFERSVKSSEEFPTEFRVLDAGGITHWIEEVGKVQHDSSGTITGITGVLRDITERKRTQQALRETNEKLQVIFDSMGEALTVVDLGGNIVDANKEALRLHGFSTKDAIIGRKASEMVAPVDRDRAVNDAIKALKSHYPSGRTEYKLLEANGREFDGEFNVAVIKDSKGKPSGFIGIARDISEHKRAEEAVRESEEKYRLLADNASDVISVTDMNLRTIYVSPSITRLLGYSVEETMALGIESSFTPESMKIVTEGFAKAITEEQKGENLNSVDLELIRKDGSKVWVTTSVTLIRGSDGRPVKMLSILHDITERKQAEQQLAEYRNHLEDLVKERTEELDTAKITAEQANKAKSDFLANMSHEIRTPLSTIIGFSELLSDETKGPVNADQKKYLGYVTSSGQHLLSLINDILDLSKVEAGKMELLATSFSMSDLLKNSLSFIVEKALKHNIKLLSKISADVDIIEADERKVKQIIYNLLSNAVKFTPDGGSVTIGAEVVSPRSTALPVKIRKGLHDTKHVLISVKDTGIGIAKKDQSKLFTEFSQIEEPYAKKYEGTGLGLALSKRLVTLHGGKIWFESKGKGKGCTFYFILPLKILPKS